MSFDDFCTAHFIAGDDKEAFRAWPGTVAYSTRMSEASWLKFFASWMRSKQK